MLLILGLMVALTILVGASSAQTSLVVVPSSLVTLEGNSNNSFPFNIGPLSGFPFFTSMRYQQVFAASEFASLAGPRSITRIAFRPDASNGSAFTGTCPFIQINLSTTGATPDGLSTVFANNIGGDDTVVFSGALSLSSADTGPVAGPKAFDIAINLQYTFLYNPAAGNLLLDVRNFSGCPTTPFDAHAVRGDSTSRLFSTNPNGVNDSTGAAVTSGLVAQFTAIPDVQPVSIDIKPGSDPNSINCNNEREVITVAILSVTSFDATTVDHTTVLFEGASEAHVDRKSGEARRHEEDVDDDGDTDLILHFRLGDTELNCESDEGTLTGETFGGQAIEGTDSVSMVGGS